MVLPIIPAARELQESLMTDTCDIHLADDTVIATGLKCRVHHERLFTETPDPQDANTRSMFEWVWTMPAGTGIEVGHYIRKTGWTFWTIVGEVMKGGTWETATRAWATQPKDAVQTTTIIVWRYDPGTDDFIEMPPQTVRIHYDRNLPEETPARYSPTTAASYKGGVVVGGLDFDISTGDRFDLVEGGIELSAVVSFVLPFQPQRREARFVCDVTGPRI